MRYRREMISEKTWKLIHRVLYVDARGRPDVLAGVVWEVAGRMRRLARATIR